ncbi:MAG TPA: DUF3467 domain-containing protein [Candidatus Acidoferrum sp.]|nr:DUF3467 domain-containing protein [Candidatus Acidoferrum sp.]
MSNDAPKPAQLTPDTAIRRIERAFDPNRLVVYSNNVLIVGTQWDIQMYFSLVHETEPGKFLGVEKALVIMTPEHALKLMDALKKTLDGYESNQGPIRNIKISDHPKE